MTAAVLVVDDEAGMRATLTDILSDAGYSVASAADGPDALDRLAHDRFDVVVMDIRMPGMDGVSVLEQIGEPPPHVIMMTAYAVEERLHRAVEAHAFAVLHKPFGVPRLLGLVKTAASLSSEGP